MSQDQRTLGGGLGHRRRTAGALAACVGALGVAAVGAAGIAAAAPTDEERAGGGAAVRQHAGKRPEPAQAARPSRTRGERSPEAAAEMQGRTTEVVGGSVAPFGAYPFFASVQTSGGSPVCGGTLVARSWVVTAAHCVAGDTQPSDVRLKIGHNRLSDAAQGELRSVLQIIKHPAWNPSTAEHDVALLRLASGSTKPWARLAEIGDPVAPGNYVRAIGHGRTSSTGPMSDDLMQVDLPLQSDATMSSPSVYGTFFKPASMVGAGPLSGGQDTCTGDDGGPLFVPDQSSQFPLVGDTSWGHHDCGAPNRPGVYGELYQGSMRSFVEGRIDRPGNDRFPGYIIAEATGTTVGTNTDATSQPGEPVVLSSADTTVWYSWTAPASGPTTFNLRDAAFDTVLAVFTGTSVSGLTHVASNDQYGGSAQSKLTFEATAGTVYRIQVDGYHAQHGPFGLQWSQSPPPNDDFANAAVLSGLSGTHFGTNVGSTGEPGEPAHAGSVPDVTVWYAWTAPASGTAVFTTRESDFDTGLAAYTGSSLTTLVQRAANDDTVMAQSWIRFPVTAGRTYRIAVDGFGSWTGSIGLQWSLNPPTNDQFEAARTLTGTEGSLAATTARATGQPGEPGFHGGAFSDNSVWFKWTPSVSGPALVRLLGVQSGFLPGVEVYTGSSINGPLTTVAEGATAAAFTATAGTTYRIAVDGSGGSTGRFTIDWMRMVCDGLAATMVGSGTITGTAGNDVIMGSGLADRIDAAGGNDRVCSRGGNDTVTDGTGGDVVFAGLGNDVLAAGTTPNGADRLNGDVGTDRLSYASRTAAVNVSLDGVANDGASGEADNALTIENVDGGSAGDTLTGSPAANTLIGNGGNDVMRGALGNDSITGGSGNDQAFGHDGNDVLRLVDGVSANDRGDGGAGTDTASADSGDTIVNVP